MEREGGPANTLDLNLEMSRMRRVTLQRPRTRTLEPQVPKIVHSVRSHTSQKRSMAHPKVRISTQGAARKQLPGQFDFTQSVRLWREVRHENRIDRANRSPEEINLSLELFNLREKYPNMSLSEWIKIAQFKKGRQMKRMKI
mmetsp:Transcript_9787/g.12093  ORF Transcript_9787/g.12093 Transcript_9787/m.12093 type:complete len:142 (+) Transcript_9787:752-1177(+)